MEKIAGILDRYCGTREEVSKRCLKRQNRISDAATSPIITFDKKKRKLVRKGVYDCKDNNYIMDYPFEQQPCSSYTGDDVEARLSFNQRVIFVNRPGENNFPTPDCFLCDVCPAPNRNDVEEGQCIVRTLYLSVDPGQRCRMNKSTGLDHLEPFEPGNLVDGPEGIGIVEMASLTCSLRVGDLVTSVGRLWPWSRLFVADDTDLMKVTLPPGYSPSVVLSAAGLSGMAALLGIRKKAMVDRSRAQTIVVSGAAGSCGSLAGQFARLEGCTKVIGICGAENKCQVLLGELGFDGAINYKRESVIDGLQRLAPEGVDIYFDNVGGFVSDAVIAQMNYGGRVVLCGQTALYNTNLPYPFPIPEKTAELIVQKNIKRERFMVLSYKDDLDSTVAQLSAWLQEGKIKVKETIYEGLERAPQAFVDVLKGLNIGKMMVKVD